MKGGEFTYSDEFIFELWNSCTSDLECDDGDPSTTDECLAVVSTCVHRFMECDEYGQMVFVNETLYTNVFYDTFFELRDDKAVMKLEGGQYVNKGATHHSKVCLGDGTYNFAMHKGPFSWAIGSNGIYRVCTEEATKYHYLASGYINGYAETIFNLLKASSNPSSSVEPSFSPSKTDNPSISHPPSIVPSMSIAPSRSSYLSSCGNIVSIQTDYGTLCRAGQNTWEIRDSSGKILLL